MGAKSQEITELREDCRRRDEALKDMATAAQATQEASEKVSESARFFFFTRLRIS